MNLMHLDDAEFRSVVEDDIRRRASAHQSRELRSGPVVPRWWSVLTSISKSVEGTLAARDAELKAEKFKYLRTHGKDAWLRRSEEAQRKRAASLRFYSAVQERILEAKALHEQQCPREVRLQEERNRYAAAYARLRDAVQAHQETVRHADDPGDADKVLWEAFKETEREMMS